MVKSPTSNNPSLKKVLGTTQLWAIAVGMVISGEYFGWNYGWAVSGTIGFLGSVIIVTILYLTFIFSYTELTTSIPDAGGPFTYAFRAFGPIGGFIAGFATLVDFVLAPPAIAIALGSYANFLNPAIQVLPTAVITYVIFIAINVFGIKQAANFSMIVTVLSLVELGLFLALIFPHFRVDNFTKNSPVTTGGIFAGLPFAIWFFVGIEGVAMIAEEVKNPKITLPKGYIWAMLTLVIVTLALTILSGGIGDWQLLTQIDHPLPEILSMALGKGNNWSKIFTSLGLFGLIASFHANTIGYSRQIYALARSGYLPSFLAAVNKRFQTPHWALIMGGLVGFAILFSETTDKIIILSVLGAVVMYVISMLSLFVLRQKEPALERPFLAPVYPYFPIIALVLSLVCLLTIAYYNPWLTLIFFGGLVVSLGAFMIFRIRFIKVSA